MFYENINKTYTIYIPFYSRTWPTPSLASDKQKQTYEIKKQTHVIVSKTQYFYDSSIMHDN